MLESHHSQTTYSGHWEDRLERCVRCERDLVQPASYEPLWGDRWLIVLECPNCDWVRSGIWPDAALRRFEDHLDEVDERLWNELVQVEKRRFDEEARAFGTALAVGAILPEDF